MNNISVRDWLRAVWWWRLTRRWRRDEIAWWIAFWMPRSIALFCFVRVYASTGDCGPEYARIYDAWEQGAGR